MVSATRQRRRNHTKPNVAGLTSWGYPSFTASVTPSDIVSLALNAGAGAVAVDANGRLQPAFTGASSTFSSAARGPAMADGPYKVSAGHGGAASSTDRGYGPGYSNGDGSLAVFAILFQSGAGRLYTAIGGTIAQVATGSTATSSSGTDVIDIRYVISGSDIIYSVYKNGSATPTNLTWTDAGGATLGIPGRYPIDVLRSIRTAGTNYQSPGSDLFQAVML